MKFTTNKTIRKSTRRKNGTWENTKLQKNIMMNLKLKEKNNTAGGENSNPQNEKY